MQPYRKQASEDASLDDSSNESSIHRSHPPLTISTAKYISQLVGELATLARNAEIDILVYLLLRAQIEAELWAQGAGIDINKH